MNEYCWRSKGGSSGERSKVAGSPCSLRSRKWKAPEPCGSFEPDLVTTLMTDEAERPSRPEKRLVAIWNSCTASCEMFCTAPPTTSSFESAPSTVTFPPRPSCPAAETTTVLVFVGSKFGAGALQGMSSASSRKLRPFKGGLAISRGLTTPSTLDEVWSTS